MRMDLLKVGFWAVPVYPFPVPETEVGLTLGRLQSAIRSPTKIVKQHFTLLAHVKQPTCFQAMQK